MDYVSTHPSTFFCRLSSTALIRGICKMQLAVRIDKRPGESHMALDGKKHGSFWYWNHQTAAPLIASVDAFCYFLLQMSLLIALCTHWMMAMFPNKCLNSMCCFTIVFALSLQNLITLLLRRLFGRSLRFVPAARPEVLSGPAVLFPLGTALLQTTH